MWATFGTIGAVLVLFAYLMVQTEKWHDDELKYDIFNFVGALILLIYSMHLNSFPFFLINLVWAGLALKDILYDDNLHTPHLQRRKKKSKK